MKVRDLFIPGPGEPLRLRVYRPDTASTLPMILYVQGGAFTYGSPEAEEGRSLRYAAEVEAVVVSVDYRLAPEHPFPAATDDAYAALVWTAANAADLGGDPRRIAVAGGSAGGTVLRARDLDGPYVALQALTYPGLDAGATSASMREFTDTAVLNRAAMVRGWQYYASEHRTEPYASPLQAPDLDGLLHAVRPGAAWTQRASTAGASAHAGRAVGGGPVRVRGAPLAARSSPYEQTRRHRYAWRVRATTRPPGHSRKCRMSAPSS
ncbi:alpha/beta hydrolase fold domain-containing protein [Streptomyces varsoviensis]|uniref:alpha/beta hydrolase fold domain-containing protein n=1 Tax=Streptomyces varsoviensis TaxID=67373 RepID=UPI0033CE3772